MANLSIHSTSFNKDFCSNITFEDDFSKEKIKEARTLLGEAYQYSTDEQIKEIMMTLKTLISLQVGIINNVPKEVILEKINYGKDSCLT